MTRYCSYLPLAAASFLEGGLFFCDRSVLPVFPVALLFSSALEGSPF